MSKIIEQIVEATVDLEVEMNKHTDTSKKIRYLASTGMSTKEIYNFMKGKVTTKTGGEIRYQHVRNVLHTILSSK